VWDGVDLPPCHDVGQLLSAYLAMRMQQYGMQRSALLKKQAELDRSSKSVAMRQLASQL